MSHFATPFIVINLGSEMVYVIEQRLRSQKIPVDKSERVLTDIVSVLLHPKLLQELFIPQPVATHAVIRQLFQDISATSIMKLDEYSMNKLWDLMTMIFKWQLSVSVATNQNIFDISRRHLRSVSAIMPLYFNKSFVELSIKQIELLAQRFSDDDYKCLYNTMTLWFSEYNTKISVLLRLGLQKRDGTFSLPTTINSKILQNLGENIYKYDNKKNPIEEFESLNADKNEISCLLPVIEKGSNKQTILQIQLPIELGNENSKKKTLNITRELYFETIATSIKTKQNEICFKADVLKTPQEDLLEMLENV